MLSAFTARPIIELRQRDKSKIETIVAFGDRVLVGLNTGALRVYRLNDGAPGSDAAATHPDAPANSPPSNGARPPSRTSDKPTDLLREVDKFSTRAIEQLAIIKEANIIVSLSNYHVSLHDSQTYELVDTLSKTKNASCFAVTSNIIKDSDTDIPEIISRLAVAVKRRLYLWSWHTGELAEAVGEVVLSEAIRSVTWASATKLVCGMNAGYVLVDVLTNAVEDIVNPGTVGAASQVSRFGAVSSAGMGYVGLGGYMPRPLTAKLANGQMLLAKDINTMFVDDKGKPTEKKQIPWQSAPESIGYSYPYILALQPPSKGSLEVWNPDTLSLMQTISLPGAAQLHFPPPTVSLAHAAKGFHISSDRCVWKMGATDYDSQIKHLVDAGSFDEAVSVLTMLEDALLQNKVETLREVKMLKAEMFFAKKKYRAALDLFNEDDVRAPPERVLKLYPPQIAGDLSSAPESEAPPASSPPKISGKRAKSPVGNAAPASPPSNGAGGLAKRLMGGGGGSSGHMRASSDAASIKSSKREEAEVTDSESIKGATTGTENRPPQGADLIEAVRELNSYLAGTRARLQRAIDPATGRLRQQGSRQSSVDAETLLRTSLTDEEKKQEDDLSKTFRQVDTTLFRAYMFSQPTLIGSLLRIPNFCDPDVVNSKLLEHNRYMELIDFLHGRKLNKQALELLKRFGACAKPDPEAPQLHGPVRTIQYLQSLPPKEIDLILQYAGWTLEANPEYAMETFTGDTENAEMLPRDRVVAFLRKQNVRLEAQYLEHVIEELDDQTPEFHNRLVELYVETLTKSRRGDGWDGAMTRFLRFLRESRPIYSLTKAIALLPEDDPSFFEAQTVVLGKMGRHKQALEIFVFKMKDHRKAEEYCNRVYKTQDTTLISPINAVDSSTNELAEDGGDTSSSSTSSPLSVYQTLLSLYLKPPSSESTNLPPALDLLSKHGSRLPAGAALDLIPNDLSVGSLESYFRGRIRTANSLVNEAHMVKGLRTAESISVAARLNLGDGFPPGQGGRNRHVVITDERHCIVCHKKLGGGSAAAMRTGSGSVVAVLPDNTIVHYGCLGRATAVPRPEAVRTPSSWGRGF